MSRPQHPPKSCCLVLLLLSQEAQLVCLAATAKLALLPQDSEMSVIAVRLALRP